MRLKQCSLQCQRNPRISPFPFWSPPPHPSATRGGRREEGSPQHACPHNRSSPGVHVLRSKRATPPPPRESPCQGERISEVDKTVFKAEEASRALSDPIFPGFLLGFCDQYGAVCLALALLSRLFSSFAPQLDFQMRSFLPPPPPPPAPLFPLTTEKDLHAVQLAFSET